MVESVNKPKHEFELIAPDKLKQALNTAGQYIISHEQNFDKVKIPNFVEMQPETMKSTLSIASNVIANTIEKKNAKNVEITEQSVEFNSIVFDEIPIKSTKDALNTASNLIANTLSIKQEKQQNKEVGQNLNFETQPKLPTFIEPPAKSLKQALEIGSNVIANKLGINQEKQQDKPKQVEQKSGFASKIAEERATNQSHGQSR